MLYYFFEYLESQYQIPGASLFTYISFRAAAAIITSLLISTIFGKRIIDFLRKKQIGESIRELILQFVFFLKNQLFFYQKLLRLKVKL